MLDPRSQDRFDSTCGCIEVHDRSTADSGVQVKCSESGAATWNETLSLICTMYRSSNGKYQEKNAKLAVREKKKKKTVGKVRWSSAGSRGLTGAVGALRLGRVLYDARFQTGARLADWPHNSQLSGGCESHRAIDGAEIARGGSADCASRSQCHSRSLQECSVPMHPPVC